jgi:lambda family phage portal protein
MRAPIGELAARQAEKFFQALRSAAGAAREFAGDYFQGARAVSHVRSSRGVRASRGERYAAASPTRLGQAWTPVTKDINTIVHTQASIIRARVQQLVRDFPVFARACNIMVNYTVGTGITYQPKVKGFDGKLNKTLNTQLEDAWNFWSDQVDPLGQQDIYGLQRLSKRQDVEAGEFIQVLTFDRTPGLYLPASIRLYEPDWLTSNNALGENGEKLWDAALGVMAPVGYRRAILGGVEYDLESGRVLAYHLAEPGKYGTPMRVPARWVSHGFDPMRPNQRRGISPFVTAVMMAYDLNEMLNAELDATQMAAKWLAFVESPQPSGMQALRVTDTSTDGDGVVKKIEAIENAVIEYLRPGEKVSFNSPNRPGGNFEPFVKFILRMVAIVTHSSYELLSGDYSGLSYSNLKAIRVDMLEDYDPIIARHVFQNCKPAHRWFMDFLFLTGRVAMPGYETNPAPYMRTLWQPSGHRSIDPLREGKAAIADMQALLRSPQEIARDRGRDLEDILMEIKEAMEVATTDLGVDLFELWGKVSTASANNPAAVAGGEEEDEGKKTGGKLVCIK